MASAVEQAKVAARSATVALARPTSAVRMTPGFLIVGAQRCGTTSLYRYLRGHPWVAPAVRHKGVHYFDTSYSKGWSWYRAHFPLAARAAWAARRGVRLVTGEASPYYMFHPLAPARLAADLPQARLILVLRNPVERCVSHHAHEVARGFEPLGLADALEREDERLAGEVERIVDQPGYNSFAHQHWSYRARGVYVDQLRALLEGFPRHQLLVLSSAELSASPGPTLARVLDFLGLPPWQPARFDRHNAHTYPAVEEAVRFRLEEHYAGPNRDLQHLLGTDLGWAGPVVAPREGAAGDVRQ